MNNVEQVKRLEIWMADYSGVKGSEQGGNARPVLVVSNRNCNVYSPVITVAPITSQLKKKRLPTHVYLAKDKYNLQVESFAMFEALRSIDKSRLMFKIGEISPYDPIVKDINKAMMIQLDLFDIPEVATRTQQRELAYA